MEFGTNAVLEDLCSTIAQAPWHISSLERTYRQMRREDRFHFFDNSRGRVGEVWLTSTLQSAGLQNRLIAPDVFPYGKENRNSKLGEKPYRSISLKGKSLFAFTEYDAVPMCGNLPVVCEMKMGKNMTSNVKKSTNPDSVRTRLNVLKEYFASPALGYVLIMPADWKRFDFSDLQSIGGKVILLDKSAEELQVISDFVTWRLPQTVAQTTHSHT